MRSAGVEDFKQSNPNAENASTSALAASSSDFSSSATDYNSSFGRGADPRGTGPSRIASNGVGSVGFQRADGKEIAKSCAKVNASTSLTLYINQVRLTEKRCPSPLWSLARLSGVNLRHEIESSSSVASLRNCAASSSLAAASPLASADSLESRKKSASLPLRTQVSTVAILDSAYNSPPTPSATNPAAKKPNANNNRFGLSGGCTIPRLKSCNSSTYSLTTKTSLSATPTTTQNVQNPNHQCSEELHSSRLASAILSADSSVLAIHEGHEHFAKHEGRESEMGAMFFQFFDCPLKFM